MSTSKKLQSTEARAPLPAAASADFEAAVAQASGANPRICLQCRKCTCGCPVAGRVDIKPHELVRLVQLGERDAVLSSMLLWECTSCETCVTRCPQQVDIPAMIDSLRQMSRACSQVAAGTTVPVFNDIFLDLVRKRGRMYEAGLMAAFKLRTMNLLQDMGKLPMMLRKRKIALLPPNVPGAEGRKRLFEQAREAEGKTQ